MPFKLRLINEFQRTMKAIKNDHNLETGHEEDNQNRVIIHQSKSKNKKHLVYKNYNVFQLRLKQEPNNSLHVVNFYNLIGLNQKAIISPDFEESKFTTIFYIKNAKKVQISSNYLSVQLCNAPISFPPVEYIIQRYKSFGDARFYSLALLLEETSSRLKSIEHLQISENVQDNSEHFNKYVETLGNKMFLCRSTSNHLVISKSLLNLLEYNSEELAIDLVKYKAPLFQIFSAERYFDIVSKMVQNLRNLFDLINDRISLETFLNSSLIRFKDYVFTKGHKKIYCKLKVGMPNPILNLIEVEEVLYKPDHSQFHGLTSSFKEMKLDEVQKRREEAEINTIRRLLPLPKNLLPQNQRRVVSYYQRPQHLDAGIKDS